MERKIGEIFEYSGEWYQCIEGECIKCDLYVKTGCDSPLNTICSKGIREDEKNVIFKKLKKFKEPYEYFVQGMGIIMVQEYILENPSYSFGDDKHVFIFDCQNGRVAIEIKQNKEDMEQGQCCDNRFEIIAKAKEDLLKATNIARCDYEMTVIDSILFRCWQMGWLDKYDDIKHSDSEKIEENLKPFSIELAKAGKPVCTRDGRKARIICFDAKGDQPIIALVTMDDEKEFIETYHLNGRFNDDDKTRSDGDLMILPEKKYGWVNVYRIGNDRYTDNEIIYKTQKDALDHACPRDYVKTIKIEWEE